MVRGEAGSCLSYPHFQFIAERSRAFASVAGFTNENFNYTNGAEAVQLEAARVSSNFFDVLGIRPALGRAFLSAEGQPGGKLVAVISDQFWRRHFNGYAKVIGRPITLDSKSYTVVGVLPASFQFAAIGTDVEVWTTHLNELNLMTPQQLQSGACYLDAVARLAPGVSTTQAQAEMKIFDQQYRDEYPKLADADPQRPVEVAPLKAKLVGGFRSIFFLLSAAVAVVLLIACANTAGLLLTRALKRRREVAIRVAMGASRKNLITQLLTESVLLGLAGGILGTALSLAVTHLLVNLSARSFPRANELVTSVDWHVLGFASALSIATGILFGFAPSIQFSKTNVSASLREEGRGTAGSRSRNFSRNFLVAGQIALSLVLLVGAGLLIRSFILLEIQPAGFEPGACSRWRSFCLQRDTRNQIR